MISFMPHTDHHHHQYSRDQQQQHQHQQQHHQYQQQRHQQQLDHAFALDCSSQLAVLDYPTTHHFTNSETSSFPSEPMQSDTWGTVAQLTPKLGRFSHQRESSLSSLGSAGPASPFASNTSNPQIAVTDSSAAVDGLADLHSYDAAAVQGNSYYQLAKSMTAYAGYHNLDSAMSEMAYPVTITGPNKKPRVDRGLLPAPDFAGASSRSHPASVASSVAGDSPATPNVVGESDHVDRRNDYNNVPKLDRTMTDVYGDELYSPNFAITSASPSKAHMAVSPSNDVFSQRINAANSHHLSAGHSPSSTTSRARSPFRTGSPFAASATIHDMGASHGNFAFSSAQRMREQGKARQDAPLLQQEAERDMEPETPKTISPKDAILEFNEADGEGNFPLFPQDGTSFEMDAMTKGVVGDAYLQAVDGSHGAGPVSFLPSQMPTNMQVPQQYPFVSRTRASHNTPPRLSSSGSSWAASGGNTPTNIARPSGNGADSGTYTCTYHGCTLRFETPSLLQKHKREGHRQTQALGAPRELVGMTSNLLNTQAGPHRCDRINPSTGKPCSAVFSRPYDLTRHEDTIHNARKQKVRCDLCTEEKTFSRADALTRHYRVCHPDMELPGKQRRRGGG
ncbi:Transcriptional regulator RPN4 [Tolypocladium ophioglossoides CBS 100239]|uniref:Transcriptional regulator RPN4 n=1 Tax=Tolypocladium ophioglossoides (strain CBS 100239) TaxID=1163406 RepID=A0A0L0NFL4_TOLOC|nr:Transcriptional regulator RPN4 [Tolypocladium ophioglossoides CBS 100239]